MKYLLEKDNLMNPPRVGEIVKGKIIQKEKSSLLLDLGNFKTGIIYGREFFEAKDILKNLKIGDELSAKIIEIDNEDGYVELSLQKANEDLVWKELAEKKEKGEDFKVEILGANKGGLLTRVSNMPAFLPYSQLSPEHYSLFKNLEPSKILQELRKICQRQLTVKVFSINSKNHVIILSEKINEKP